ncbi:MAG: hypothetical protein Q4B78_05560 [Bacillota bacterium]|nr:hypothetical protein [Bacillota bacterium]
MRRQQKVIMTCPFCGEVIGKCSGTDQTEIICNRCGKYLVIVYRNHSLTVREDEAQYKVDA